MGNPIIPLPSLLKNPAAPSLFALSIGAVATPVTPEDNESKKELAPVANPYNACFGLFLLVFKRRRSWNSLSIVATDNPLAIDPVTFEIESENPKTDFLTKLNPPLAIPIPNSCGRSFKTNPW